MMASKSLVLALAGLLVPVANGAIVADFADGNGTTLPDQWTGVAGNGWATGWGQANLNAGATGVVNTTPLHGGGNYLQATKTDGQTQPYIRRQYSTFGEVNITQPHRITMSFRYDTDLATFTAFSDRIAIFGDTAAVTGSAATNTWLIGVGGGNSGAGTNQSVYPGNWYFIDNNGNTDFSTANMFDTGLALVEDRVYAITVDVNPAAGTYSASINDGVNPVVSAADLTFRRGPGVANGSWFHIVANSGSTDAAAFSIDNLTIVPEPTGLALAGVAAIGLLRRRRR